MRVSIICPCYNEQLNLVYFFEAIIELKNKLLIQKIDLEVIIVDDYSTDNSVKLINAFVEKYEDIILVRNSRNYGVYRTSYIGLYKASGDVVVPMFPVDLQDPPEVLYDLIMKKNNTKTTGVFGRKIMRQENFILSNLRILFYLLLDKFSNKSVNRNVGEFGVVDKWVVDECLRRNDYYPYLRGMISNITSDLIFIDYTWKKRIAGKSKHNIGNLYDQGMNAFVSSGTHFFRPLVFLGFLISITSISFSILNMILYFTSRQLFEFQGIASLIVITSFLFGFLIVFMGFLGEYIVAIHSQVRGSDRVKDDRNEKI